MPKARPIEVSYASKKVKFSPIAKLRDKNKELYKTLGDKLIEFGSGDVGFPVNNKAREGIIMALDNPKYHKYPPTKGDSELIERLSVKLREKNRINIGAEGIEVTCGGMQAIFANFGTLVNPGDRAIIIRPYWSPVKDDNSTFLGISDFCDLEKDFSLDLDRLKSCIKEKTKILYINSPHNPTGTVFDRKTLEGIADIALKNGLFVISDEAYESILFDDAEHVSIASIDKMKYQSASVFTFSKTYNMTGFRIGYLATANKEFFKNFRKYCLNSTNGVPWIVQRGALAALDDTVTQQKELEEYKKRRDVLVDGLREVGFNVVMPKGTYYCYGDVSSLGISSPPGKSKGMSMYEILLKECNISTCPGEFFGNGWGGYLRFGFSIENEDRIREAIYRMKKRL